MLPHSLALTLVMRLALVRGMLADIGKQGRDLCLQLGACLLAPLALPQEEVFPDGPKGGDAQIKAQLAVFANPQNSLSLKQGSPG